MQEKIIFVAIWLGVIPLIQSSPKHAPRRNFTMFFVTTVVHDKDLLSSPLSFIASVFHSKGQPPSRLELLCLQLFNNKVDFLFENRLIWTQMNLDYSHKLRAFECSQLVSQSFFLVCFSLLLECLTLFFFFLTLKESHL